MPVFACLPLLAVLTLWVIGPPPGQGQRPETPAPGGPTTGAQRLLDRIWAGVQRTQQYATVCGGFVETRTSTLLLRPLVLRATFCVQGTTGFRVDYTEPEPMTVVYSDGYMNVTTDRGRRTEALEAGSGVARAMGYFGKPGSIDNLRRDFAVVPEEARGSYVLRMEPVAGRFKSRTGPVVATFDARTFHITRLEVNGVRGVRSVFDIRVDKVDVPLDPVTFRVYRPGPGKERRR